MDRWQKERERQKEAVTVGSETAGVLEAVSPGKRRGPCKTLSLITTDIYTEGQKYKMSQHLSSYHTGIVKKRVALEDLLLFYF